jgi:predicted RNA-binding protein
MCDSSAYLLVKGQENLLLEHIDHFESIDNKIKLISIFGEEKEIKAKVKSISLLEHKILLEQLSN